jgi:glycosyltransferase involved in cell wall biosynthesis
MSTPAPRVSVLLPVRNGLPWLTTAIESVLTQTFRDFELIVLEDGSTDGTPELLSQLNDTRLRIVETGGVGIAAALNMGLDAARGAYIARQDADDESVPERLARQVAVLERHPRIAVVSSTAEYIDADGRPVASDWVDIVRRQQDTALTPEAIRALMPLTCCITHGSILARADALRRVQGYREDMVPAEDYDLWLRLLPEHQFAKLPERLYRHRLHGGQTGARARDEQTRKAILAKLQFVRRVCPTLPDRPRLAVVGSTRGDRYYRDMAPMAGFDPVDRPDDWDVLAVTDFATIDAQYRQLSIAHGITRIGNCFVSHQRGTILRTA